MLSAATDRIGTGAGRTMGSELPIGANHTADGDVVRGALAVTTGVGFFMLSAFCVRRRAALSLWYRLANERGVEEHQCVGFELQLFFHTGLDVGTKDRLPIVGRNSLRVRGYRIAKHKSVGWYGRETKPDDRFERALGFWTYPVPLSNGGDSWATISTTIFFNISLESTIHLPFDRPMARIQRVQKNTPCHVFGIGLLKKH
jgi:hypothetical protein